jgi:chromosomal replication initiation ATPase DnaA
VDKIEKLIEERDNIKTIIKSTCLINNLSLEDFKIKSRERRLIDARRMAYALCKDLLDFGWSRIGYEFKKNHASIIHHYKVHKELLKFDPYYLDKYEALLEITKCEIGIVDIQDLVEEARKVNRERLENKLKINKALSKI